MKVGQKVRIRSLKDRVDKEVSNRIGEVGIVKEPRILDGLNLGYIVKFTDNRATWFFVDELEAIA